jgi:hypothetical protein
MPPISGHHHRLISFVFRYIHTDQTGDERASLRAVHCVQGDVWS